MEFKNLEESIREYAAYVVSESRQNLASKKNADGKLYQSITELPENDVMRKLTCAPNSIYPKVWDHNRKRGRPKQQWAPCVFKLAIQMGIIVV